MTTVKEFVAHQRYIIHEIATQRLIQIHRESNIVTGHTEDGKDILFGCHDPNALKKKKKSVEWEQDATYLLQNIENLWNIDIIGEGITSCLVPRLEHQVLIIETAMQAGVSLGPQFSLIQKMQDDCSMLKWCIKAISFSSNIPTCKKTCTKDQLDEVRMEWAQCIQKYVV